LALHAAQHITKLKEICMAKILGALLGYWIGGFWGMLLGIFLGHQFDRARPSLLGKLVKNHLQQVQRAFFEATFSVMGHVAKADGRVSEEEIAVARQVMQRMNLSEQATREAMALFARGKAADFDLQAMLLSLAAATRKNHGLLRMFIEIQLAAAFADGELDDSERGLLLRICSALGFSQSEFVRLEAMIRAAMHSHQPEQSAGLTEQDAYAILNIDPSASDAEVKRAYRRLTSQHHPDKLAAKGLPEEMMKLAAEKTHEIRSAYESIRSARGFR
jgi:DnaJ like chaperone protein